MSTRTPGLHRVASEAVDADEQERWRGAIVVGLPPFEEQEVDGEGRSA